MKQAVNILMIGGAKRVSIGRMIKRAGTRLGMEVGLFSYELSEKVPVSEIATIIVGMRWSDPGILDDLHRVVAENSIDIILPFVDPAVELSLKYAESDPSVWTPGSNLPITSMMFNKIEADSLFREFKFPLPPNPAFTDVEGEIIAKPCYGSASKGIKVLTKLEYNILKNSDLANKYLFQKYFAKRKEYTVDCYVDHRGVVVCAVPRLRVEVSGGEVTETVTIHDPAIERLSHTILKSLQITGPVTLQFLREVAPDGSLREPMLMEINPRLGGGVVCAVHAGADIPMYILKEFIGETISPNNHWRAGTRICRYPEEVVFHD